MPQVLIIDDNHDLRDMLALLLEDEGYGVVAAGDGESGVTAFRRARPDLVLSDVVMPDVDGIEAIRQIRAIDPNVRIIAMSGGSLIGHDYYLRMAKQFGAMAVLPKPFEVDELVRVVASCLRSHPSEQLTQE